MERRSRSNSGGGVSGPISRRGMLEDVADRVLHSRGSGGNIARAPHGGARSRAGGAAPPTSSSSRSSAAAAAPVGSSPPSASPPRSAASNGQEEISLARDQASKYKAASKEILIQKMLLRQENMQLENENNFMLAKLQMQRLRRQVEEAADEEGPAMPRRTRYLVLAVAVAAVAVATSQMLRALQANTCQCEFGEAAQGIECLTNNGDICSNCFTGFHLADSTCEANVCKCTNGKAATDAACIEDKGEICASCAAGFHLDAALCKENKCTCKNGDAAEGVVCTRNEGAICTKCEKGFHLANSACEANPCTAPTGVANSATGGSCREGSSVTSGSSCTTQCASNYRPSRASLSCTAGTLVPSTFTCHRVPSIKFGFITVY